jgi:hypothetical protein
MKRGVRELGGKFSLLYLAITALSGLAGCAGVDSTRYQVQAPFDSFVCYYSSLDECSQKISGTPAVFSFLDAQAGVTVQTADKVYACNLGAVTYQQTLDTSSKNPVSFYSPVLLGQMSDGLIKLNLARAACTRLVQSYNKQVEILALQDQLAVAQLAAQYLSTQIENESLGKSAVGAGNITEAQRVQYGLSSIDTTRNSLQTVRNQVTTISEQLRSKIRDQTLNSDYKNQFSDAQTVIDGQIRELSRGLFILDRAVPKLPDDTLNPVKLGDRVRELSPAGGWVVQGTGVLSISPGLH